MILISIQPEHCKNIFNGSKTVEWRTKPLPICRAVVYETIGKYLTYYESTNPVLTVPNGGKCSKKFENGIFTYKVEYIAKGRGKVIGEIEVIRTLKYATVDEIPESVITTGCVSREFLKAYSKGKPLYANCINNPQLYKAPKELGEFRVKREKAYYAIPYDVTTYHKVWIYEPLTRPPQSWINVKEEL